MPNASWTGNLRAVKWIDMEDKHGGCHGEAFISHFEVTLLIAVGMKVVVNHRALVERTAGIFRPICELLIE